MNTKKVCFNVVLLSAAFSGTVFAAGLSHIEQVGKSMYQDKNFSFNGTQSCLSCHHHISGFADPTNMRDPENTVVSLGADGFSKGGRNAPSSAYAGFSPKLTRKVDDANTSYYVGGMFWDGRADGDTLGDPLAEQAQGPPLNPVEMGSSKAAVVQAVRESTYARHFLKVFGSNSLDDVDKAYDNIARAIAAYERSTEVQAFTSRYDNFLTEGIGLNAQELNGLSLFKDNCIKCHSMETNDGDPNTEAPKGPLFTNYTYANIGVPVNPLLADNPTDYGLGGFLSSIDTDNAQLEYGKFKVPTLRNVAMTAPYSHNGYFSTIKEIVQFKNTRDVADWMPPEVPANLYESSEGEPSFGSLGLTEQDVDDIVAFLNTLTDR